MNGDINKLIGYVGKQFVFDDVAYPELKGMSEEQKLKFALRHSALHFAKTAGKISEVGERFDHGKEINIEDIKKNIPKALINTLKLAEIVGMTEEEIIRAMEEKYKTKIH